MVVQNNLFSNFSSYYNNVHIYNNIYKYDRLKICHFTDKTWKSNNFFE